jgi:hypothetical protein
MKLIGITGRKKSGKDTAARALITEGYWPLRFAGGLKAMVACLLTYMGIEPATIEKMIDGDLKEMPFPYLEGKSCRQIMQTLGTEWGRDCVGRDLWVHICMERAKSYDKVVVTDVRFKNEEKAIREAGGKIVKIERPTLVRDDHPSEAIDKIHPDLIIMNTGTIKYLQEKITEYARRN